MLNSANERAGLASGSHSDEVYTPSPRRSEGQCGQLFPPLFEPHCEQNLSANPKRTAKSYRQHRIDTPCAPFVQKKFQPGTNFISNRVKLVQIESFSHKKIIDLDVGEDFYVTTNLQNSGKWRLSAGGK